MQVESPTLNELRGVLRETPDNSLHFVVIAAGALESSEGIPRQDYLADCVRVLRQGGLLFVHGLPENLAEVGVLLDQQLNFKYWIAVESPLRHNSEALPSVHAALLLFTKGNGRFNIKRTRSPHQKCRFCGKSLRDWGGKSHLMHPDGYVISDVWRDLTHEDNYARISSPVLDRILQMLDFEQADLIKGLVGPKEALSMTRSLAEPAVQYRLPGLTLKSKVQRVQASTLPDSLVDVVHFGDALEVLRQYPDDSIDMVFADPPYNLDKLYNVYDDGRDKERYLQWCDSWLGEYVRILKPTGSLYVLNLPRWTMYHAAFLNQRLYFQNWIVWDALSEPRGKLMPAHYGLLLYTKRLEGFTFNYDEVGKLDAHHYCLRASCIRSRKRVGSDDKEPLTDLWWDVHRIKHRRDRDYHPCQLPKALVQRMIRLSTNPGDVVLDAFSGTGTTPVAALELGRRYVAIDIDEEYVQLTKQKIAEIESNGHLARQSIHKPQHQYTKKELQLELRDIASRLGRLPTPEDVREYSRFDLEVFFEVFPTWGKALKAAKVEMEKTA